MSVKQTGMPGFATSQTHELVKGSQRIKRYKAFGRQSADSTLERVKETFPLYVDNCKSLDVRITKAEHEREKKNR